MPSVRRFDAAKLRARSIIATAALIAVTVAFLLLKSRSAPVIATPPAPGPSTHAAGKQVPSDPREAEQTPVVQVPMELETLALSQHANDAPADQMPPAEQITPARLEPSPAPNTSPKGSEQRLFKSRRALETVDPREILRQGR